MVNECEGHLGKDYDLTFEWNDDKMYCSEYIWKVYDRALGIQVGELQKLKDFDLENLLNIPAVHALLEARYGGLNNIPLNETVISPAAIFDSDLLEMVKDTYPDI